jgi:hypothetical protein
MLAELRKLEEELKTIRQREAKNFEQFIKLDQLKDEINYVPPEKAMSPADDLTMPLIACGEIQVPGKNQLPTAQVANNNWDKVASVITAGRKIYDTYEQKKITQSKDIVQQSSISREEMLGKCKIINICNNNIELRKTLFLIRRKKVLSEKDKNLAEAIQSKLRNLDQQLRGSPSAE